MIQRNCIVTQLLGVQLVGKKIVLQYREVYCNKLGSKQGNCVAIHVSVL